jgi:hypothetical protein
MVSLDPAIWAAAIMTIGIYSLGFKYTVYYKFCEYTFVGLALGFAAVLGWDNIQRIGIEGIANGKILNIIPILLGILLFARFIQQYNWISFYPLSVLVGVGTGIAVRGTIVTDIVKQTAATIKPLWGTGSIWKNVDNLIFIVIVLTGLLYFVFTINFGKGQGESILRRIGRYGLMMAFGAQFGNTAAARFAFLIGRMQLLLFDWLQLG